MGNAHQKYLNSAVGLHKLKRYEEAIEQYKLSVQYNPSDSVSYYNMGQGLYKLKRYEEAIEQFKLVIQYNPSNSNAYNNMGNSLAKLKRYEEAIEQFKLAFQNDKSFSYDSMNNNFGLVSKTEVAIEQCKLAIKYNPSFLSAYCNLGFELRKLKRYEEAIEQFKLSLQYDPSHLVSITNIGELLMIKGRYDEAEKNFKRITDMADRSDKLYELNYSYLAWMMTKKEKRDYQTANQIFTNKLNEKLLTNDGRLIKAILLYKIGDFHSSLLLQKTILNQMNIGESVYYYYMAMCLFKSMNGQYNNEIITISIEWLNKAIKDDKEWVKSYYRRAQLSLLLSPPLTDSSIADYQFVTQIIIKTLLSFASLNQKSIFSSLF